MPEKAVHLLVVDGFADWEPAHAVAELRRHGGYRVETVGLTSAPVESMGGVRVLPSTIVTEVDLLGRVFKYKDVWLQETTYSYDQAGRLRTTRGPVGRR